MARQDYDLKVTAQLSLDEVSDGQRQWHIQIVDQHGAVTEDICTAPSGDLTGRLAGLLWDVLGGPAIALEQDRDGVGTG